MCVCVRVRLHVVQALRVIIANKDSAGVVRDNAAGALGRVVSCVAVSTCSLRKRCDQGADPTDC